MENYLHFLLSEYDNLPDDMLNARKQIVVDDGSTDILLNTIIESNLKSYVSPLIDYKLEKIQNTSGIDLLQVDNDIKKYSRYMGDKSLKNINTNHFSPIYRVGAFIADYLIRADRIYNANKVDANIDQSQDI